MDRTGAGRPRVGESTRGCTSVPGPSSATPRLRASRARSRAMRMVQREVAEGVTARGVHFNPQRARTQCAARHQSAGSRAGGGLGQAPESAPDPGRRAALQQDLPVRARAPGSSGSARRGCGADGGAGAAPAGGPRRRATQAVGQRAAVAGRGGRGCRGWRPGPSWPGCRRRPASPGVSRSASPHSSRQHRGLAGPARRPRSSGPAPA